MKQFFRYLFVGAVALIPLLVIVQLIFWIKSLTVDLFVFVSSYTNSGIYTFALILFIIVMLAFVGSSIEKAGKSFIVSTIDKILTNVPAIGTIYSIIKKITALFTPDGKDIKKEVVLVEYPKPDLWVPAYVLSTYDNSLVLFVPTSPNPTSGYTVIVDRSLVQPTTLSVAEASQFIVSMGADFVKKEEISKIIQENLKNKQ